MTSKLCPKCQGKSYSAAHRGEWICPYCGEDLEKIANDDKVAAKRPYIKVTKQQRTQLFVLEGGNINK